MFTAVFISFALTACQKSQKSAQNAPQAGILTPVKDVVVAKVGGTDVLYSDVRAAATALGLIQEDAKQLNDASAYTGHEKQRLEANPLDVRPMSAAIFNSALEAVISNKLLAQDARRLGLDKAPVATQRFMEARERILGSVRVESYIRETVTENAMRELYETQAALANLGDEILARHIIVESKEDALDVVKQLEDGKDFEALAADISVDKDTRDRGGDLGYFTADMLNPDFSGPLFAAKLSKGKAQIAPFETGKGWHVAEILDRRRPDAKSYEDSREALRNFLTFDAIESLMRDLRAQGDVTLFPLEASPKAVE